MSPRPYRADLLVGRRWLVTWFPARRDLGPTGRVLDIRYGGRATPWPWVQVIAPRLGELITSRRVPR